MVRLKDLSGLSILLVATSLFALSTAALANAAAPAIPYLNPWLAKSAYPVAHASTDFTPIAGPTGPTRRLRPDEIQWKTVGPVNTFGPMYSGPYPNGKRVIWVGGYDRVTKLDANTLDVLTTYALGGNTYFGDEEIRNHIARMDRLDDQSLINYGAKILAEPFPSSVLFYRLLSRDNELYMP